MVKLEKFALHFLLFVIGFFTGFILFSPSKSYKREFKCTSAGDETTLTQYANESNKEFDARVKYFCY